MQVVQTIGCGVGSEDGAVRGVVLGIVVADAGDVVLDPVPLPGGCDVEEEDDPDVECTEVNELDPHAARPVETSTAAASAPRVVRGRGVTRSTLCPGVHAPG